MLVVPIQNLEEKDESTLLSIQGSYMMRSTKGLIMHRQGVVLIL